MTKQVNIEYINAFNFKNKQEITKLLNELLDDLLKSNLHSMLQKYNFSPNSIETVKNFILKKKRYIGNINVIVVPPYIIFDEPSLVIFGADIHTKQVFVRESSYSAIQYTLRKIGMSLKEKYTDEEWKSEFKDIIYKLILHEKFFDCFFEYDYDVEVEEIRKVIVDDSDKKLRLQGDIYCSVYYYSTNIILRDYLRHIPDIHKLQDEFYNKNEQEDFFNYVIQKFQKFHIVKMKQYTHEHTITLFGVEVPFKQYILTDEQVTIQHPEHGEISIKFTIYKHLYPLVYFGFLSV